MIHILKAFKNIPDRYHYFNFTDMTKNLFI